MIKVSFDFETYSECNLKKRGLWPYAMDPSTRVLCVGYAYADEPAQIWVPDSGEEIPRFFRGPEDYELHAWNSLFEWAIWTHVLKMPTPPMEHWHDTAALAGAMALPRALGNCGSALGISADKAKNKRGYDLIKMLSIPHKKNGDPDLLQEMYQYCMQDVVAERAISKKLYKLVEKEREIWVLDQLINIRGIGADVGLMDNAIQIYAEAFEELLFKLKSATGLSNPNSPKQFLDWLVDKGHIIDNVQKGTLTELIDGMDTYGTHEAIKLRLKLAKTAPKKYASMRDRVAPDSRLHGNTMYHGASTGRWSSTGVNLQNIARPTLDAEHCIDLINGGDLEVFDLVDHDPMESLSSAIRGVLVPEQGKKLIIGDFASIESRALAWLAGEEEKLEVFRTHGKVYEYLASKIYSKDIKDVTKDERFVGKTGELACGFQGGAGALTRMAANYGTELSKGEAENIKNGWRKANPEICNFWTLCEDAAIAAILHPCQIFTAKKVKYTVSNNFLWCLLPSGRKLAYHRPYLKTQIVNLIRVPEITEDEEVICPGYNIVYNPHEHTVEGFKEIARSMGLDIHSFEVPTIYFWGVNSTTRKWTVQSTYGGKLVENITQAVARDLMAEAMLILDAESYTIVLTVHDEIISEVPTDGGFTADTFTKLMETIPEWAEGLPIQVEAYEAERYRK